MLRGSQVCSALRRLRRLGLALRATAAQRWAKWTPKGARKSRIEKGSA